MDGAPLSVTKSRPVFAVAENCRPDTCTRFGSYNGGYQEQSLYHDSKKKQGLVAVGVHEQVVSEIEKGLLDYH